MRFHEDTDNRFHPRPCEENGGDSPMIAACYEAHLAMEKMLAVFAELRGDDAEAAIG